MNQAQKITKKELDIHIKRILFISLIPLNKLLKNSLNIEININEYENIEKTGEIQFENNTGKYKMYLDIVNKDYKPKTIVVDDKNKEILQQYGLYLIKACEECFNIIKKQNDDIDDDIKISVDNSNLTLYINENDDNRIGIIFNKIDD